jgi:large subunit ribosomal protein L22
MKAIATLRYMKGSAQKARLVADLVRGKPVNEAVAILRHTRKYAARDILKTLRSAVANAEQKEAQLDVDELVAGHPEDHRGQGPAGKAGPAGPHGARLPGPPPQEPLDDRARGQPVREVLRGV